MLLTDDEYHEFVGERRRRTGPSDVPVTAPHPTYGGQSYDWTETLPDYGAGNDPFGYMNPQDIGLQPDRPTYNPFAEQEQDLLNIGVDTRRDSNYGLNFGWTFAPAADMGGLDTVQGRPDDGQVMTGVENLPGWDPYAAGYTRDPGYSGEHLMRNLPGAVVQEGIPLAAEKLWPVADKVFFKPTDALTETAWDFGGAAGMTLTGPGGQDLLAASSRLLPGMDFPFSRDTFSDLTRDARDPMGAADDFRERPWYEQLALSLGWDPTNYIPLNPGAAKAAYAGLLGPEGSLVEALAKAQGREGLRPVLGLATDNIDDAYRLGDVPLEQAARKVPAPLDNGAEVVEHGTNRVWKVAKGYSGDEEGLVQVIDPETGNTERISRFLLREPGAEGAVAEAATVAAKLEDAPVSVDARSADGAVPAEVPGDIKLPRTADGNLEPPRTPPPAPSGDQSFTQAIMNHLQGEWYYRISGLADAELRVGRRGQAEGILAGLDSTGDSAEALRAAREGARGRILSTREPLVLTAAQRVEANDAMVGAARTNKITPFELLNVQDGLDAMLRGERPQPRQMQLVRKVFGDDVADLAYKMPVNEAARQRQMVADAKKVAENWERAVKKETARQQAEIARAQNEAGKAFERAMKAERRDIDRARAEAERAAAKAAKAIDDADRKEIEAGRRLQAEVQRKAERDAQRALVRENRAGAIAAEARDRANPNDEQIIQKAKGIIEAKVAPELQATANAIVDTWVKGNRVLLDGIGEASNRRLAAIARNLRAGVSGHLGDSYVTQLVTQRSILRGTLEEAGVERDLAKKMADLMVDEELAKRYKGDVPERIKTLLARSKGSAYNDEMGTVMRGAATFNQWWKNTAFGLMDIGVVGVQGLHSAQTGGLPILAGMANRAASLIPLMPHVETSGELLARRAQYALDGLIHGPTGIADDSGTFLGQLGRAGKAIDDHTLGALLRLNNRVSFGMLLGNLRALAHEGNLVLAKAAGADITDPAVRRASAVRANSATMAAFRPASSRRALAEQATMMTGSMTRAQVQQVDQVVRGFLRPANRAEFMMSAATIASVGLSAYVFGKALNDAIGMDEFEWDPGKPNWGNISVPGPNGTVYKVNVFPQHQVAKYTIQAIEALAKAEPGEAERAMLKLGLSRSGPSLQVAEKVAGYGFDPINGKYAMGDWGKNMSSGERIASVSGLPPTLFNILTGSSDSIETTAGFFGMSAFKETASQTYDRRWRDGYGGRKWGDLSSDERAEIEKRFGQRPYAEDPEIAKSQRESDAIKANRVQHEIDAAKAYRDALGAATTETEKRAAGKRLRDELARVSDIANAQYEQWAQGKNFGPQNPLDEARSAYFDTFKQATVGGVLDEEKQQGLLAKLEAGWSAEQKAYVEAALGRRKESTDATLQELFDAQKTIRDSGYFDVTENKRQWRQAHPEIDALLRKYGYGETTTKAMDSDAKFTAEQQADDAKLKSGNFAADATKAWRERYDRREAQRAAAKDVLYGDLPEKERDALSMYYNVVDTATAANGEIDWDLVDRWLKRAPKDVRDAVAARPDTSSTPLVKEFKAARKQIAESGYWDVSDAAAQQFTDGQYRSMTAYREAVYKAAYEQMLGSGYTPFQAKNLAEVMTDDYLKPVMDAVSDWREEWRYDPKNFELVKQLIRWGYWTPGKKDSLAIANAGGTNW